MNDAAIRALLHESLRETIGLTIDEFGVGMAASIADVVSLAPDALVAYEIKSAEDTLKRLFNQSLDYNDAFDYVTLVTEPCHLDAAREMIPWWWGILVATPEGLRNERTMSPNPGLAPRAYVQRLWKDEVQSLLRELGEGRRLYKPLSDLYDRLVEVAGKTAPALVRRQLAMRILTDPRWRKRKNGVAIEAMEERP